MSPRDRSNRSPSQRQRVRARTGTESETEPSSAADSEPEPAASTETAIDPGSAADGAVIGAAIDVGADSIHLLVAAVAGHRVEPLLDESVFLGLGDRVARDGKIGPEARRDVVNALASYAATASRLGAEGDHHRRHRAHPPRLRRDGARRGGRGACRHLPARPRPRRGGDADAPRRDQGPPVCRRTRSSSTSAAAAASSSSPSPAVPSGRSASPWARPGSPRTTSTAIRRRPPRSTRSARSRAPRSSTPRMPTRGT